MPGGTHPAEDAGGGLQDSSDDAPQRHATVFFHDADEASLLCCSELFDDTGEHEAEAHPEEAQGEPGDAPQLLGCRGAPRMGTRALLRWVLRMQPAHAHELSAVDEIQRRTQHFGQEPEGDDHGSRGAVTKDSSWELDRLCFCPEAVALHADGVFEKRSPWWFEGWRPRNYVLRDRKLLYFRPDRPDKPLGVLDMGLVRYELHCCWSEPKGSGKALKANIDGSRACDMCDLPDPGWLTFYMRPVAFPSKVFAFRGPRDEILALTDKIARLVSMPIASTVPHETTVVSLKNFWRYPFTREHDFLQEVESADIMLFRGKDTPAKLQQAATGGVYDHVALLMRLVNNELYILEATGRSGVKVLPWQYFKKRRWHQAYLWIAYRKVYFARTKAQMDALRNYVSSVLGSPYGLNLGKLLDRRLSEAFDETGECITPDGVHSTNIDGSAKTSFFCSELAAACLKRCGVLAGRRASSRYWPSSFGQDCPDPLPLQEGAYVGEERVIVFGA